MYMYCIMPVSGELVVLQKKKKKKKKKIKRGIFRELTGGYEKFL